MKSVLTQNFIIFKIFITSKIYELTTISGVNIFAKRQLQVGGIFLLDINQVMDSALINIVVKTADGLISKVCLQFATP